jgi:hypothetical protein
VSAAWNIPVITAMSAAWNIPAITAMSAAWNIPVIISGKNIIPSFTLLPTIMFQSVSPIFLFSTSPIEVYSVI